MTFQNFEQSELKTERLAFDELGFEKLIFANAVGKNLRTQDNDLSPRCRFDYF